ncbi:MAG: hypothetical protein NZ849_10310 [Meiothermus sp.]|uniref:hypothetical protein n=1 Tax=Meiothermus sp. TaxID=1955249 RepID=UPI0025EE6973|nr:hypothetical protein [Meiothermus sp.]MCS7058690.1 hypothetical protein [Meiothermus sp.]MCS7195282.1 hypothetical protein [Meiothermus sp.]MCX7741540.1 hypothetical protein [Meiothermus sp.]MDW8089983.1 hypothetical protein [Meiothermus sp.]MDW8480635.1 hypothetical protein [Meiothermus sp.]
MRRVWFCLLVAAVGFAEGQEASVYKGFAELRQPQNLPPREWVWEPGAALFESLVPGTLRLLGVEELSRWVREPAKSSPLEAYVGKEVQFYWEGQWRRATLVSAQQNLYLYEGRYLVGLPGVVAYPDPGGFSLPPGPRVVFRYRGGGDAVLAYLTRGLSWSPRYSLEDGVLVGWAALTNTLGYPLRLGRTELVAGQVPLVQGELAGAAVLRAAPVMAEDLGEVAGTYRYRLPGEVEVGPGVTELPFLQAQVQPVYVWRLQTGFSTGRELFFNRGFRFVAPQGLAAGVVSLWERGVFVGQAALGDTPRGASVVLVLGPDPEGRASRQVQEVARNRFRVTTAVRNPKAYPLEVEIQEVFPQPFELEADGLERLPEGYRLRFALAPGQSHSYAYTLVLQPR